MFLVGLLLFRVRVVVCLGLLVMNWQPVQNELCPQPSVSRKQLL